MSRKSRLAMLRHLSPVPKRSTMTRSDRPASLRAAPRTEPIKPPPPVITSIGPPASGGILAGAGGRHAGDVGLFRRVRGPNGVDEPRCRTPLDEIDQHGAATRLAHLVGADHPLYRVVAALDEHTGLETANQLERGLLVEADHRV